MVLTNIVSISYAVFATRPKIGSGHFSNENLETGNLTSENVTSKTIGLMKFDDFYKMSESDYNEAVENIMSNRKLLYNTIKETFTF